MEALRKIDRSILLAAGLSILLGLPLLVMLGYEGFHNFVRILVSFSLELSSGLTIEQAQSTAYNVLIFLFQFTGFVILGAAIAKNLWIFARAFYQERSTKRPQ